MVQLRPAVRKFAEVMEEKLRLKDWKGGWSVNDCSSGYLSRGILDEYTELLLAIAEGDEGIMAEECVDIANFAMMAYHRYNESGEDCFK